MFYEEPSKMDHALRFGDVLRGFAVCTPIMPRPLISGNTTYQIDISVPPFCVVLSPCCSIADKIISLAPLIPLRSTFFDNPYLEEDLTRLNRIMAAEHSLPPQAWSSMDAAEKARRLSKKPGYAFFELFVYREHDLFPAYVINRKGGNIETKYYMIDFRSAFKVNCELIKSPKVAPLESKCLQLTVEVRDQLREKIAYYYSRKPVEDMAMAAEV